MIKFLNKQNNESIHLSDEEYKVLEYEYRMVQLGVLMDKFPERLNKRVKKISPYRPRKQKIKPKTPQDELAAFFENLEDINNEPV